MKDSNSNGWTPERRQRQAQIIHQWKPWKNATGAKTKAGKQVSRMNAQRFTIFGLYRQAVKLCKARKLYFNGRQEEALRLMIDNEIYIAVREARPTEPSPKAAYCRRRRKELKTNSF